MSKRLALQAELETILGNRNVYFQPPENVKINYPCIVYKRDTDWIRHANDSQYIKMECYDLTVIDKDPESEIPENLVSKFQYCRIEKPFISDNMNHIPLRLFY